MAEGINTYVDIVEGNILWSLNTLVSVGRNILWNFFNVYNQWVYILEFKSLTKAEPG